MWTHHYLVFLVVLATGLLGVTTAAYADYYFWTPTQYVYEAAPDHSLGWRYFTNTRVQYTQYSDHEYISENRRYWNILDTGVDSNCQVGWTETPDVFYPELIDPAWYDYWNTPVYTYGSDFWAPNYGDGSLSLSETYDGWTDYSYCQFWVWWSETGGWIVQTFKKNGSWRWYACHHNATDPDCPNWQ